MRITIIGSVQSVRIGMTNVCPVRHYAVVVGLIHGAVNMMELKIRCPRCGREKIRVGVGCNTLDDLRKKAISATCYKCARQYLVYGREVNRIVKVLRVLPDSKYSYVMGNEIRSKNSRQEN